MPLFLRSFSVFPLSEIYHSAFMPSLVASISYSSCFSNLLKKISEVLPIHLLVILTSVLSYNFVCGTEKIDKKHSHSALFMWLLSPWSFVSSISHGHLESRLLPHVPLHSIHLLGLCVLPMLHLAPGWCSDHHVHANKSY